jgi:cytochrome c oxidase subunit 2
MVGTRRRARLRLTPLPWAVALGLAAAGAVLGLAGCGGSAGPTPAASSSAGSPVQGKGAAVFTQAGCGSCHTLAAANSGGTTGPDLDEVLPGQSEAEIEESIVDPEAKIAQGYPAGVMPENFKETIQPEEIKELVEYLAENAGKE